MALYENLGAGAMDEEVHEPQRKTQEGKSCMQTVSSLVDIMIKEFTFV